MSRRILTAVDLTLALWPRPSVAQEPTPAQLGHGAGITALAFAPDGQTLASIAPNDRTLKLWDARTGKLLATLTGHLYDITSLAFAPSGELLLSGSEDGTARVWNARTGELVKTILAVQGR